MFKSGCSISVFRVTSGTNRKCSGALRFAIVVVSFFECISYRLSVGMFAYIRPSEMSNLECLKLNIFINMIEILRDNDVDDLQLSPN